MLNRVCTIHIICFDCPFKLDFQGRRGNRVCQYGKTRSHHNIHGRKRLKQIEESRYKNV